jgi:eukaryotic-like serine/threonine-protein kinase
VLIEPVLFGKYQLLALLTRGGMGEVWKARSHGVEGFEKTLVVKRILPALSEDARFVEMFVDEAKLAVALTHANIVQVFDLGVVDGQYFIAMEYVPGLDLGRLLALARRAGRRLPSELAVYIASEVAKALDYAHRRRGPDLTPLGIVHRDVSPENVLISLEGEVKLADFGIARSRDSVVSPADLPPGKYAYLAPEQARREELDARADVFALGAVLFEMLTGEKALPIRDPLIALEAAARGEHRSLLEVAPEATPELVQVVARAMASDRALRHISASELYDDLIQVLYTSGRRVGALDLARAVAELVRTADHSGLEPAHEADIQGLFDELGGAVGGVGRTPLQVPPRSSLSSIPAPLSRGLHPRPEWRDVTVLGARGLAAQHVLAAVLRFGGELYPLPSADGSALAVFGLGDADGRDAQAASRCALALKEAHAQQAVELVVHSGRLLVDADGRAQHSASLGALRAEIARWLARAQPGVFASPSAVKQMRGRFELLPAQAEALRPIARELAADEGVGKFVGRREELRAIGEVFALAHAGSLRVLGLRGEAGAGKSRLLVETLRRLRHAGHDVGMYVANCALAPRGLPLGSVQQLVRVVLGAEEREPDARVQEKVDRLRQLGLSSAQRDAIARVLGLRPSHPAASSTAVLESALLRIAYKLAQDRLTVFAWDGAELMDTASRELVQRMVRNSLRARVVVALTYRPGEHAPPVRVAHFDEVQLRPLTNEDVGRLVRHRLVVSDVPDELVDELWAKTGGNPLYAEELLAALGESGAFEIDAGALYMRRSARNVDLPRTLRGLVASRVGRLSQPHRTLLQLAVTIGHRFSPELVARAAQLDEAFVRQGLAMLESRDIVRAVGPEDYAFAHELVRDVLYESISAEERPQLHASVAEALESLKPAEQNARLSELAYHCCEAGDRARATAYLVRAAERYEAEQAFEPALAAYLQTLAILESEGGESAARALGGDLDWHLRLYARLGEIALRTHSAELVAERLGPAIELAERAGHDDWVARFAMTRGRLLAKSSRFDEGRLWLERAHVLAQQRGDLGLMRDVALAAAEAHARNGEYRSVVPYVADALELARATDDESGQLRALTVGATAYAAVGDRAVAVSALTELARLASRVSDHLVDVEVARVRAAVSFELGQVPQALEAAREAVGLAREYGFVYELALSEFTLGTFYLRAGEDKRAFPALRQSYELATEHGFARLQWLNVCMLGYLDVMALGAESARARMVQAVRFAEGRGYVGDVIIEKYALAVAEQRLGDLHAATELLREVSELGRAHGHLLAAETAERGLSALHSGAPIQAAQ